MVGTVHLDFKKVGFHGGDGNGSRRIEENGKKIEYIQKMPAACQLVFPALTGFELRRKRPFNGSKMVEASKMSNSVGDRSASIPVLSCFQISTLIGVYCTSAAPGMRKVHFQII